MAIDIKRLKNESDILRELIEKYKFNTPKDFECFDTLLPIFEKIDNGDFDEPYTESPCSNSFSESSLGDYADLEEAYYQFLFTAEGGDRDKLAAEVDKLMKEDNKNV